MEQINLSAEELILQEPNLSLDFRGGCKDSFELAQLISAFANTDGGTIVFGVNSKKKIIGVNPDEVIMTISDCNNAKCIPPINYQVYKEIVGRFYVLKVVINKSRVRHVVSEDKKSAFYRIGSETVRESKIHKLLYLFKHNRKESLSESAYSGMFSIIVEYGPISLSQLYEKSSDNKGKVELNLAFLLFEKKIFSSVSDNVIMYSII